MAGPLMRPNVLLVVFDTARADGFEPYGAGIGATPAVAELATRGWAAHRAYSTSNWTLPSHASIFSGLLPRELGLGVVPEPPREVIASWTDRMLATVLAKAGYSTRGLSANPWVSRRNGFDAGFEVFKLVPAIRRHYPEEGLRDRLRWWVEAVVARLDDGMTKIAEILRIWMDEARGPFFWFVNLMECHAPYLPPRPYNDLSLRQRICAGRDVRRYNLYRAPLEAYRGRLSVPPRSMARLRHLYARAIRAMDDWLARCLEDMDQRGLLESTVVVVTSDHGEYLGERGLLGHIPSLDEYLIRVPLVMAGPDIPARPGVASLADVPRLIAEAIGLGDHPWKETAQRDGYIVAQTDGFLPMGAKGMEQVREAWGLEPSVFERMNGPIRSASDGRLKLIRTNGREELIEVDADPMRPVNVIETFPDVAERLRAGLDRAEIPTIAGRFTAGGDEAASTSEEHDAESADLEKRMRLLGYL